MEDLLSVLPFGGRFDMVTLKGSTLKEAFEHSVRRYGKGSGELLQVGGTFSSLLGFPKQPSLLSALLHWKPFFKNGMPSWPYILALCPAPAHQQTLFIPCMFT